MIADAGRPIPFSWGTVGSCEEAQDVREGIDHAETGQVAGVAQILLGDGRHVDVLDGTAWVTLGGSNMTAERFQTSESGTRATPVRTAVEPMRES